MGVAIVWQWQLALQLLQYWWRGRRWWRDHWSTAGRAQQPTWRSPLLSSAAGPFEALSSQHPLPRDLAASREALCRRSAQKGASARQHGRGRCRACWPRAMLAAHPRAGVPPQETASRPPKCSPLFFVWKVHRLARTLAPQARALPVSALVRTPDVTHATVGAWLLVPTARPSKRRISFSTRVERAQQPSISEARSLEGDHEIRGFCRSSKSVFGASAL